METISHHSLLGDGWFALLVGEDFGVLSRFQIFEADTDIIKFWVKKFYVLTICSVCNELKCCEGQQKTMK